MSQPSLTGSAATAAASQQTINGSATAAAAASLCKFFRRKFKFNQEEWRKEATFRRISRGESKSFIWGENFLISQLSFSLQGRALQMQCNRSSLQHHRRHHQQPRCRRSLLHSPHRLFRIQQLHRLSLRQLESKSKDRKAVTCSFIIYRRSSPIRIWHPHSCHSVMSYPRKCSSTNKQIWANALVSCRSTIQHRRKRQFRRCTVSKSEQSDWRSSSNDPKMPRSHIR